MGPDSPYINAGVLFINLEKWRQNQIDQKFLKFLTDHKGKVTHHDQGIINGVCKERILLLHPKYNVHSTVISHPYSLIAQISVPYYTQVQHEEALKNPTIIHYTEGFYNRPWKKNCKHPLRQKFTEYNSRTPWANSRLYPDDRTSIVRSLSWIFLNMPYPFYRYVRKALTIVSKLRNPCGSSSE